MNTNLLIVDNFYSNPDQVREHALQQSYDVTGNYPGRRTRSFINDSIKEGLAKLLEPHAGKVLNWHDDEYSGAYQYTISSDRSWIHHDDTTSWAGVLYLTPNAPLTAGTAIYQHKETGFIRRPDYDRDLSDYIDRDSMDITKWNMVDRVSNIFNRLVIYRGDLYHMSQDYFGKTLQDGRLFQTFFITTEY